MSNASNVGTSAHSLGESIERLRGKWAAITAFGVLLVVLGFAALAFSLVATIVTVTLNGILFLIAGGAEIGIGMHAREWGAVFSLGDRRPCLHRRRGLMHRQSHPRFYNPDAFPRRRPYRGRCGAGLSGDTASSRPSPRPRLSRSRRDDPARFDHCEPLAARQRLCSRRSARRRPLVSRRWLGELRHGIAGPRLSELESPRLSGNESARLSALGVLRLRLGT